MKKLMLTTALLLSSSFAFAQFTGSTAGNSGGYNGPTATNSISTVKQALSMPDDTYVTLQGKITTHIHKDKYNFSDGTGNIVVEIDHDDWHGVSVGPNDKIEIYGEVDRDSHSIEIDVDSVRKIN